MCIFLFHMEEFHIYFYTCSNICHLHEHILHPVYTQDSNQKFQHSVDNCLRGSCNNI